MMKTFIGLVLLMLSNLSFGSDSPLIGSWTLHERICTDGLPPKDNLEVNDVQYNISFNEDQFQIIGSINLCGFKASGTYELEGKVLKLNYHTNQDCRGFRPLGSFHGPIFINNNEFSTVFAGFGFGGSCLPREFLISTFRKSN